MSNHLIEFTEFIVKSLVDSKDLVSVKEFPTSEDNTILLEVMVSNSDIGKIIGKKGKTANAIRNLVQIASKENKKVKLNFDAF